jgi:hypothetical protein
VRREELLEELSELLGVRVLEVARFKTVEGTTAWEIGIEEPHRFLPGGQIRLGGRYRVPNSTFRRPQRLAQFMTNQRSTRQDWTEQVGRDAVRLMHRIAEV